MCAHESKAVHKARHDPCSAKARRPPPPQLLERRAVLLGLLRRSLRSTRLGQARLERALELVLLGLGGAGLRVLLRDMENRVSDSSTGRAAGTRYEKRERGRRRT